MSESSTRYLKPLYHLAKNGKLHMWRIWTEDDYIVTEHGTVDGEKQVSRKRAEPKNLGRSNETSAQEQAVLEAKSAWTRKRDLKYHLSPEEAARPQLRPMLADRLENRLNRNVSFPAHIQPKLDGLRALVYLDDGVEIMSRSGKSYREIGSVDHIARAVERFLEDGLLLDGELYAHGESFQTTTSIARKYYPGESEKLVFHVYDIVEDEKFEMPWLERFTLLQKFGARLGDEPIRIVHTEQVEDVEEVFEWHSHYLKEGYEGAVLRLFDGPYEPGRRSHNLLKVKEFQDEEFRIVEVREGRGKFEGHAIFRCETPDGRQFDVAPKGTMEERAQLYRDREDLVGQYLKVQFFEKSEDGIPRFPVGLGIRAPEDMDAK